MASSAKKTCSTTDYMTKNTFPVGKLFKKPDLIKLRKIFILKFLLKLNLLMFVILHKLFQSFLSNSHKQLLLFEH